MATASRTERYCSDHGGPVSEGRTRCFEPSRGHFDFFQAVRLLDAFYRTAAASGVRIPEGSRALRRAIRRCVPAERDPGAAVGTGGPAHGPSISWA